MKLPAELAHIEFDQEQAAAVLSYAEEHNMSPKDVVLLAVDLLTGRPQRRSVQMGSQKEQGPRDVNVEAVNKDRVAPLPDGFVSRHPDRDYSSFGSANGIFGDGLEYQKTIRDEW